MNHKQRGIAALSLTLFGMAACVVGIRSMIMAWTWKLPEGILFVLAVPAFIAGLVFMGVFFRASVAEIRNKDAKVEKVK
jgi:uncharacterized integral membrane protein